jgi:Rrf2 family protein
MMVVARETGDGNPVNLAQVADKTRLPRRYLEQVAISLKNAGLLRAVSGKNGGHLLTRPAREIKLGEIVEAAIGPINIVECLADPEGCMLVEGCECRSLYNMINLSIKNSFNSFTLADLAERRVAGMVKKMKVAR